MTKNIFLSRRILNSPLSGRSQARETRLVEFRQANRAGKYVIEG